MQIDTIWGKAQCPGGGAIVGERKEMGRALRPDPVQDAPVDRPDIQE